MSHFLSASRRTSLILLAALALGTDAQAQARVDPATTEDARQAARALVAANPQGTAPIQPAVGQAVLEATEEGGRAAAVIGLDVNRVRLALRMEAPFESGQTETDFVTLDRLPGDSVVRGSFAYELYHGLPNLQPACTELNQYSLRRFGESRALGNPVSTVPLVQQGPVPKVETASTDDLAKYVRGIRQTLQGRPQPWAADLLSLDQQALREICAAESNHGSIHYVEPLVGVTIEELRESLRGRSFRICSLAALSSGATAKTITDAAAQAVADQYSNQDLDEQVRAEAEVALERLRPRPANPDAKRAELLAQYREALRAKKAVEISSLLNRAAYDFDRTLVAELRPRLLELMRSRGKDLAEAERAALVEATLAAFLNPPASSQGVREPRKEALQHALSTYWPHATKPGPATPGNPSPLPQGVAEIADAHLASVQGDAVSKLQTNLRADLARLPSLPPGWNEQAVSRVEAAAIQAIPDGTVADSVWREFLSKLIEPYSKLADTFNQLPKDLINEGSTDCSVKLVEARLAALPRGGERNRIFQAFARKLPTLLYFTVQGETGAKSFSWLASVPPTINSENRIATEKDTKYNSSFSAGFTLFHGNLYWSLSYSDQRLFQAQDPISVCATFPSSDSTLCRQGAPGPPNKAEPEVIEASVKHFFSPEFAGHVQALYDLNTDTFNPHIFLYFFAQKGKGLRGGFDLSYVNNHPTEKDGVRGRIFFGMPFTPPFGERESE